MNAPAKLTTPRDRYRPIVSHHCPGCDGEEMMLRCSLLLTRDMATAQMRRCSEEAESILATIAGLTSSYAFAAMPLDELRALRAQIVRLTSCASGIEMFAFRLAHPDAEAGGPNARG